MKRHYYVTTDLDDLEVVNSELEQAGISASHLHVLTDDTAATLEHHLHPVNDLMRRDVMHTILVGAAVGLLLSALVLGMVSVSGLAEQAGWTPFILLCIVIMGFSTWEGGLFGIQRPSPESLRFRGSLKKGRHVLLVDVNAQQEGALARIVAGHPALRAARDGMPDLRYLRNAPY